MEILTVLLIWPFLFLAAGLVFVAFSDLFEYGLGFIWLPVVLLFLVIIQRKKIEKTSNKHLSGQEQLEILRKTFLVFSISLLFPIFIRYLVDAFNGSLVIIILGLLLGFVLTVWGMFIKHHAIIMYSNIIGGALIIAYLYTQLWELGEFARIVVAASGLIAAVGVSVIKLKDKLI